MHASLLQYENSQISTTNWSFHFWMNYWLRIFRQTFSIRNSSHILISQNFACLVFTICRFADHHGSLPLLTEYCTKRLHAKTILYFKWELQVSFSKDGKNVEGSRKIFFVSKITFDCHLLFCHPAIVICVFSSLFFVTLNTFYC